MNPLKVITLIYLFSFSSEPIENLTIFDPQALSIDLNNNIYVADSGNNRVLKFSHDGEFINAVGGFGWEKEQFDNPVDICAKSALDIFVVDYNNERIERYDKDLHYISSLNSDESLPENLQFGYPHSVSISRHGELILVDSENYRLLKINSFGEPEMSFGDFAEGEGKLDNPIQIEISSDDKVYVSDKSAQRIIVFDYFGNYLSTIGKGLLQEPGGIFVDAKNRLWVTDSATKKIYLFTAQGDLLLNWDSINKEKGKLKNPVDIVFTNDKLYVLDDDEIYVFSVH